MSPDLPEAIARLTLGTFDRLPQKCLPRTLSDGKREWTVLSSVVLSHETNTPDIGLKIVSLATGTKSLPASIIPRCNGTVLHDCHAEVLALRGFNRWLLEEIERLLLTHDYESDIVEPNHELSMVSKNDSTIAARKPFRLKAGISIYLFTTEAPCGDASMDILQASFSHESAVPWSSERLAEDLASGIPLGRGHFSLLGALRRKPSRADAEPSLSKSCTDKIMLKQFTGLLSFPIDAIIESNEQSFLKGLVVYENQFNDVGYERAFGKQGRLMGLYDANSHFFEVQRLPRDFTIFRFQKQSLMKLESTKPTNVACIWVAGTINNADVIEVIINGVKQGFKQLDGRPGKQSILCRKQMTRKALQIMQLLTIKADQRLPEGMLYAEWKYRDRCQRRTVLKKKILATLGGWPTISAEDDFQLEEGLQ